MKDNLSYRVSDEGEGAFKRSCKRAQEWIDANCNGPLKLKFGISLSLSAAEGGESVQDVLKTGELDLGNDAEKPKRRSRRNNVIDGEFDEAAEG